MVPSAVIYVTTVCCSDVEELPKGTTDCRGDKASDTLRSVFDAEASVALEDGRDQRCGLQKG